MFLVACTEKEPIPDETNLQNEEEVVLYQLPDYDKTVYYPGIPILTNDSGRLGRTETNSKMAFVNSEEVKTTSEILRKKYNAVLQINYTDLKVDQYAGLKVAFYKDLVKTTPLPIAFKENVTGYSFRMCSIEEDIQLKVQVLDSDKSIVQTDVFSVVKDSFQLFKSSFKNDQFHSLDFMITNTSETPLDGKVMLDDIYLTTNDTAPFAPPQSDTEFLQWIKKSALSFFLYNYESIEGSKGAVPESAIQAEKISISGVAYAMLAFEIAAKEGIISTTEAKEKTLSILRWLQDQNWFDGSGGWHGFPHHYLKKNGTYFWPDISTVDVAICTAALRIIREKYNSDAQINAITTELISRPNWDRALGSDDRIALGLNGSTGEINQWRWGLAYSEETELVFLEAVASGKISSTYFDKINRNKKNGFYPSWFGSGFTYNWLQILSGTIEPYSTNSALAFQEDLRTSQEVFGLPLIGLTAVASIKSVNANGYVNWSRYIGNQGSFISGAQKYEVIQRCPAPYGAVLALPFIREQAITALRNYVEIGYYHPIYGLPNSIQLKGLESLPVPIPNWNHGDIEVGPLFLAIEQTEENTIGALYQSDPQIQNALTNLINTFEF
jgi:hypothetical protein